jgi:hypothetical protein
MRMPKSIRERRTGLGQCQKMNVIRHQAPRPNCKSMFGSEPSEQAQVHPAVCRIVKDVLPRIAACVTWCGIPAATTRAILGISNGEWRISRESLGENRELSILSPDFERGDWIHFGRSQRR